jgi:hypothetical protein
MFAVSSHPPSFVVLSIQCDPGSNNDYVLDSFFSILELYNQRPSMPISGTVWSISLSFTTTA